MIKTTLLNYKILKLIFDNSVINTNEEFQIQTNVNSHVNYDEEYEKCVCTYTLKITTDKEDLPFNVEVVVSGVFSYDKHDDKKEIHVEVSRKLFPYLQSTTSALMAMAGIPNFVVPEKELKVEDVTV